MGIGQLELMFLLNEHKYKPIAGEVFAIGRQNTAFNEADADDFLRNYGVPRRPECVVELDHKSLHGNTGAYLSDVSLMSMFSDCKFYAADISAYEGADFIFDICGDVPDELNGRFDFVMDGGSLDNVFDPFRMMRNMASMLKPGGRMFLTPWVNSHPTAYVKLSPDWIMDYFAVNEFEDAKVYVFVGPLSISEPVKALGRRGAISIWQYDPCTQPETYQIASIEAPNISQVIAIGELGQNSTSDRPAIQSHYRGANIQPYIASAARFAASPRPIGTFPSWAPIDDTFSISGLDAMKLVTPAKPAPTVWKARWQAVKQMAKGFAT